MAARDLTTLAKVKTELGIDPADTSADAWLTQKITDASFVFESATARRFTYASYPEVRDGNGTFAMEPYNIPIVGVDHVFVDNTEIPVQPVYVAGDAPPFGWVVANDRIEIVHYPDSLAPFVPDSTYLQYASGSTPYAFRRGFGNVLLQYRAGFVVPAEAQTIPSNPGPYTLAAQDNFFGDLGVTFANGGAGLVKVASAPTVGQYAVDGLGNYTFAAADAGKGVLLNYWIIPRDVDNAVRQLVAHRYREKDRLGQRSVAMPSGTSVQFDVPSDGIPPTVKPAIARWTRYAV